MNPKQRAILFWAVCIPTRLYIASLPPTLYTRTFAAVIGVRWVLGYENGKVGAFGGPAWWADQRVAHGALWSAYAISAEPRLLYVDAGFGALNWFTQASHLPTMD